MEDNIWEFQYNFHVRSKLSFPHLIVSGKKKEDKGNNSWNASRPLIWCSTYEESNPLQCYIVSESHQQSAPHFHHTPVKCNSHTLRSFFVFPKFILVCSLSYFSSFLVCVTNEWMWMSNGNFSVTWSNARMLYEKRKCEKKNFPWIPQISCVYIYIVCECCYNIFFSGKEKTTTKLEHWSFCFVCNLAYLESHKSKKILTFTRKKRKENNSPWTQRVCQHRAHSLLSPPLSQLNQHFVASTTLSTLHHTTSLHPWYSISEVHIIVNSSSNEKPTTVDLTHSFSLAFVLHRKVCTSSETRTFSIRITQSTDHDEAKAALVLEVTFLFSFSTPQL